MADYIETIPQEKFDMSAYRTGQRTAHECDSVGCVVGHCTVLDKNPLPMNGLYNIDFLAWSRKFTGLDSYSDNNKCHYLFSFFWTAVDNTPVGTAKRIRYIIEHGLPEDWYEQMHGRAPLSYLKNKTA